MNYDPQSFLLFMIALGLYFLASLFYFSNLAFRAKWQAQLGSLLATLGVVIHAGSIGLRWATTWADRGWHIPLSNMYEYTSFFAFFLMLSYLIWQTIKKTKLYGGIAAGLGFILMGVATIWYGESGPLMPALKSYWLDIHVMTMVISSGVLGVGFVFAALYLLKERVSRMNRPTGMKNILIGASVTAVCVAAAVVAFSTVPADPATSNLTAIKGLAILGAIAGIGFLLTGLIEWSSTKHWARAPRPIAGASAAVAIEHPVEHGVLANFPDAKTLDHLSYRVIAFGFPLWTLGVIAGAVWAEQAWGRYWGWDPKETWSFITWLIYAGYLHARVTVGWRGRKAAVLAFIGFAAVCFTFFAVNLWISGLHSYAT